MKLEWKYYPYLVDETQSFADVNEYVSEMALSTIWGDPEGGDIPDERIEFLRNLWEVTHMTIKDIIEKTGLSQRSFSERFCIRSRTIQHWVLGDRKPTTHQILTFAECLGLYKFPFDFDD